VDRRVRTVEEGVYDIGRIRSYVTGGPSFSCWSLLIRDLVALELLRTGLALSPRSVSRAPRSRSGGEHTFRVCGMPSSLI
jgi:hypothetical protein